MNRDLTIHTTDVFAEGYVCSTGAMLGHAVTIYVPKDSITTTTTTTTTTTISHNNHRLEGEENVEKEEEEDVDDESAATMLVINNEEAVETEKIDIGEVNSDLAYSMLSNN
jgi:hypothetical protein